MGPYDLVELEFAELLQQLNLAPPAAKEDLFRQGRVLLKRMEVVTKHEESVHQKIFNEKTKRHRNMIQHLEGNNNFP